MRYAKPPLNLDGQIALLRSRGLLVSDVDKAKNYLSNISYYRLSAYMLPLKEPGSDNFLPDTDFQDVLNLYLFDREFRILVFDAIERLEIAFRTQIIYHPSLVGGAFWFEDGTYFDDPYRQADHLQKIDDEVYRATEVFKDHFFSKYDEHARMPAWMTFEVVSLGLLSKIYRNLKMSSAKKDISKHFGLPQPYILESWMQSITYVRNVCAHHSRLWNRVLTLRPQRLKKPNNLWISDSPPNDKMYYFLCCILYLLRSINP
ncbi:MAG TPA: Abi family protein, partial [Pyrinomonadaceae bacterium]